MKDSYHKKIFANNLQKIMAYQHKTRMDICRDLKICYSTLSDWINGNAYPRIDKIEKLAHYFQIQKSDLIEEQSTIEDKAEELLSYMNDRKLENIAIIPIYYKLVLNKDGQLSDQYISSYIATGQKQINLEKSQEYFYYEVSDDSLDEKVKKGDLVLIHKQKKLLNNDIGAILINGNILIRKYQFNHDWIILQSMSKKENNKAELYAKNEIKIIGKAIGFFGEL